MQVRPQEGIDHFNQSGGLHNCIQLFKPPPLKGFKWISKEAFRKVPPLLALSAVGVFVLAMGWVGKMSMRPRQPQRIEPRLRNERKKVGMNRFHLTKRGEDIVTMGPARLEKLRKFLIFNVWNQAQDHTQIGTDLFNRPKPTRGRAKV